jgi:hypothetical protein
VRRGLLIAFAIVSSVSMTADPRFDAHYQPRQSELTDDGRFTFVRLRWGSDFNCKLGVNYVIYGLTH